MREIYAGVNVPATPNLVPRALAGKKPRVVAGLLTSIYFLLIISQKVMRIELNFIRCLYIHIQFPGAAGSKVNLCAGQDNKKERMTFTVK